MGTFKATARCTLGKHARHPPAAPQEVGRLRAGAAEPEEKTTTPANKGANAVALLALVFFASAAPVATQLVRRPDGSYPFEVVDVVLRAEILKLCIAASCLAFELRGLSATERRERAPTPTTKGLLLTLAVGAGYQALNILGGFAMRVLDDPTLFAVIVQSKVVWTGVLGVYAFGRRLSSARVFSLRIGRRGVENQPVS